MQNGSWMWLRVRMLGPVAWEKHLWSRHCLLRQREGNGKQKTILLEKNTQNNNNKNMMKVQMQLDKEPPTTHWNSYSAVGSNLKATKTTLTCDLWPQRPGHVQFCRWRCEGRWTGRACILTCTQGVTRFMFTIYRMQYGSYSVQFNHFINFLWTKKTLAYFTNMNKKIPYMHLVVHILALS